MFFLPSLSTRVLGAMCQEPGAETNRYIFLILQKKIEKIEEQNFSNLKKKLNTVLSTFLTLKRAGLLALLSVCKYYTGEFFLQNLITLDQLFN